MDLMGNEIPDDGVVVECAVCGRNIHAGSYPPVCRDDNSDCYCQWLIETANKKEEQK